MPLLLFGYGSLLFAPERPEAIVDRFTARLDGLSRRFNKPSRPRGIPRGLADWHGPLPDLPDTAFALDDAYLSLALGTALGGHIDGEVLVYRDDAADDVMARMHRREGVRHDRPAHLNHYRCRELEVRAGARTLRATSWVSNPGGDWHVEGLTLAQEAAVLRRATPGTPQAHAKGARYLFGVEAGLARRGLVDPYVTALAHAVRALG